MTTLEVANRYCELAKQKKWTEILHELCGQDLVNRKPNILLQGVYNPSQKDWKK